jgi:O-methyltransferase involved in polyketide biosynthesis
VKYFGANPRGGMASRSVFFDQILTKWLKVNPEGYVVSLGEGLETQSYRVDNGKVRWFSIDLPEAIAFREKFIEPTERFKHLAQSAFDSAWMDEVDPSRGVFICSLGLFMYFEENKVSKLITEIFRRFSKVHLLFDFVSPSFVRKTQKGLKMTNRYTLPTWLGV